MAAQGGCDDDCVMALACAATGINNASMIAAAGKPSPAQREYGPFTFNTILKEMQGNRDGFPVKDTLIH